MAKGRAPRRAIDSYTIKGTNKIIRAGDCILMRPSDSSKPPYVAKVEKIESDSRGNVKVRVRWYYRPEESIGGRRQFHGAKEVFLSDHYDVQSADTIEGKCTVHSFKSYTKLDAVGNDDYFCRFEYNSSTGAFNPDRVAVLLLERIKQSHLTRFRSSHSSGRYCKCEMPYNPDDLMVQCEGCTDWFHPHCIDMTAEEAKRLEHFFCQGCSSQGQKKLLNSHTAPRNSETKDLVSQKVIESGHEANGIYLLDTPRQSQGQPGKATFGSTSSEFVSRVMLCHFHLSHLSFSTLSHLFPYKVRLVTKGYTQTYGIDYLETFAPIAKMIFVRVLPSLAAHSDWPLYQLDVKNAFLNGKLHEETQSDHTLFVKRRGSLAIYLIVYGDDIVVTGNDVTWINDLKSFLHTKFEIKDLGELRSIVEHGHMKLEAYTDTDWAGNIDDRRLPSTLLIIRCNMTEPNILKLTYILFEKVWLLEKFVHHLSLLKDN
ncbi:PREDICTED: uncharacterized protein LOC104607568 [Nelumbo nucifera]|uniref:Uncharacterized protein LOC104607568 n=1 Tax=Nelumbo nucifera TaxID=4432 RepID=A0A1U8QAB0_NELNU|nr:PREDICTED: uncharacterized protein LOC104607568 [Nelumbo nucifera]